MAVEPAMRTTTPRSGRSDLLCSNAPFQIEIDQPRLTCSNCKETLIEAHFLGARGWQRLWRKCGACGSCRRAKQEADTLSENVRIERMRARLRRSIRDLVVREDGLLRCARCGSTLMRTVEIVRVPHMPSCYVVTWTCWLAGHVILERWRVGSPVRGHFPFSDAAPTLHADAPPLTEQEKPLLELVPKTAQAIVAMNRSIHPFRRKACEMKVVEVDFEPIEGCDERCTPLRYSDPDASSNLLYVRMMHSPHAHNEHGVAFERRSRLTWDDGLSIDLDAHTVTVHGHELEGNERLTPKEWAILICLLESPGTVVAQQSVLRRAWGAGWDEDAHHILRVNMARLRAKLDRSDRERWIKTVKSSGYLIRRPNELVMTSNVTTMRQVTT